MSNNGSPPASSIDPNNPPWHQLAFDEHFTHTHSGNLIHWTSRACDHSNCDTTIVFLHGVLRNWRSFYTLFNPLFQSANIVSVDFRGHGRSASTPQAYRVVDYVADAVHVIEQLPGRIIVYGHSLGAMVALAACTRLPKKVSLAVLEDPPFATMGNHLPGSSLMNYFEGVSLCLKELQHEFPERPHSKLDANIARAPKRTAEHAQSPLRNQRFFEAFSDIVVGLNAEGRPIRICDQRDEPSRRFTGESLAQVDPNVLTPITTARWLDDYDITQLAHDVDCPIHLLQADASLGGMLVDQDVELLRTQLGSRFQHTYFPGVGHSIHWSQPEMICDLMRSQLGVPRT